MAQRSAGGAHLFFQPFSRRYEKGAMPIASNRTINEWRMVFGDAVVAAAILDRPLYHSNVATIRGPPTPSQPDIGGQFVVAPPVSPAERALASGRLDATRMAHSHDRRSRADPVIALAVIRAVRAGLE